MMVWVEGNELRFNGGIPSNFFRAPIRIYVPWANEYFVFATNEHYFQAMKACLVDDAQTFQAIQESGHPIQAKRLGRSVTFTAEDKLVWDDRDAAISMLECNIAKYRQHYTLREWLLTTKAWSLVEHRPDPIWGNNLDGTGKNLLGKTLELVRALVE